jgi:hypothetical protein
MVESPSVIKRMPATIAGFDLPLILAPGKANGPKARCLRPCFWFMDLRLMASSRSFGNNWTAGASPHKKVLCLDFEPVLRRVYPLNALPLLLPECQEFQ